MSAHVGGPRVAPRIRWEVVHVRRAVEPMRRFVIWPRTRGDRDLYAGHFPALLALLFSLFVLRPVGAWPLLGVPLNDVLLLLVFGGVVRSAHTHRATFVLALLLAVPAAGITLVRPHLVPTHPAHVVGDGLIVVLFGIVCARIAVDLFAARRVGVDSVSAALCLYLLVGLGFAFLYDAVEQLQPGSFTGLGTRAVHEDPRHAAALVYFSFVTLTTLGYGDVAAVLPVGRGFAVLEALLGQVVLVVLVARLVGMQVAAQQHVED